VFYSKRALLVVAGILTLALIAFPLLTKDRSGLRVSFVDSKTAAAAHVESPVMENPEYRGQNESGAQYKINGTTATQKTPTLVVIAQAEGQMLRMDGKWYHLTADRAEYQQDKKIVDLFGNVTVYDMNGTTFVTEHATVEMQTMHIWGTDTITGTSDMGNIVASGFEIEDNGDHIIFYRGADQVHTHVIKEAKQKQ
jgi:lipopolysaccharide export system protein LptC